MVNCISPFLNNVVIKGINVTVFYEVVTGQIFYAFFNSFLITDSISETQVAFSF